MHLERFSLIPAAGYVHVRAGQVLKVRTEHTVPTVTRAKDNPHIVTTPLNGQEYKRPTGPTVRANIGDLAVEIVSVTTKMACAYAYLAGPAAQLHMMTASPTVASYFEPARVERMTKLERFCEEMGTDADPERIAELESFAIAEMQRAKHADLDIAILDIEAGDAYKKAATAVQIWWRQHAPAEPRPDHEITCHLVARLIRNRKIALSRHRKSTGAAFLHSQPQRHAGWPPATVFHMQLLLEATLPS